MITKWAKNRYISKQTIYTPVNPQNNAMNLKEMQ